MLTILPYKNGSVSARILAKALGVKRIMLSSLSYRPRPEYTILNWGNSKVDYPGCKVLNKTEAVRKAINKLTTFEALKAAGVRIPAFTTDRTIASEWQEEGYKIVARHKVGGYGGEGIQIVQPTDAVPEAKLYTRYVRKDKEYRVHVFGGRVIDFTEKRRRTTLTPSNPYVRSHKNGWVFCRVNAMLPDSVRAEALKAVAALGLDFGGVDVVYREGKAWVLEVNCAPGISGTTLNAYVNALRSYVNA